MSEKEERFIAQRHTYELNVLHIQKRPHILQEYIHIKAH